MIVWVTFGAHFRSVQAAYLIFPQRTDPDDLIGNLKPNEGKRSHENEAGQRSSALGAELGPVIHGCPEHFSERAGHAHIRPAAGRARASQLVVLRNRGRSVVEDGLHLVAL